MNPEAIAFWVLGTIAVIGALGVVAAPKAVYSALWLATTMIALAIIYVAEEALFLGVVQIVVYTGAVMMLFLFVLMLIGVDSAESLTETIRGQRIAGVLAGLGFGVLLVGMIGTITVPESSGLADANGADGRSAGLAPAGNVEGLAQLIFTRNLWAFELTSALLITAALGAMVLAHRERLGRRKTQREMATDRFRDGSRATPLPNPGVFAQHNAVDTAALLPDGSEEPSSVNAMVRSRQ